MERPQIEKLEFAIKRAVDVAHGVQGRFGKEHSDDLWSHMSGDLEYLFSAVPLEVLAETVGYEDEDLADWAGTELEMLSDKLREECIRDKISNYFDDPDPESFSAFYAGNLVDRLGRTAVVVWLHQGAYSWEFSQEWFGAFKDKEDVEIAARKAGYLLGADDLPSGPLLPIIRQTI